MMEPWNQSAMEPISEVPLGYTFLGISVVKTVPREARASSEPMARSGRKRRTRAGAKKSVFGVFRFPSCCSASSTLEDPDPMSDFSRHPRRVNPKHIPTGEVSSHIPYVPKYIHSSEIQRTVAPASAVNKLQRKVVICAPNSGSRLQATPKQARWRIDLDNESRWESPLRGWTPTGDSFGGVGDQGLHFDSKEAAITFAQKYGWSYKVKEVKHKRNASLGNFET